MYFLLAFRTGGADYNVYLNKFIFSKELSGSTEVLFTFYNSIFHFLGLSFENFKQVSAFLCLFPILFVIFIKSEYPCRALACYMIYSYPIDGVQIRSTLAFGVIIIGFICLEKNEKKAEFIFIISVIIATMIHTSSALFIIFILLTKFSLENLRKKILYAIGIEWIAVFTLKEVITSKLLLSGYLNTAYLMSHAVNSNRQILIYSVKSIIMILIEYFLLFMFEKYFLSSNENISLDVEFVKKMNLLETSVIPLYFFSVDLYRIQRYLFIFFLIIIFGSPIRGNKHNKFTYWICAYSTFFIIYFMFMIRSNDYSVTINSLLTENAFL